MESLYKNQYMIMKSIGSSIGISESTLYPILKRLEQNGSLKTYRKEYNGRMRKYYQLTSSGQKRIDDFLEEWKELERMYEFVKRENEKQPWTLGQEEIQPEENRADTEKGENSL